MSMPRIDAHQHFWKIERGDYGWLTPELEPIYRDFRPRDYTPFLEAHAVAGTVLVQAAPTIAETEFLLSLADENPFIKGVVGWVNFTAADAPDRIAALADHPRLVGLRPEIQDFPDGSWILRPEMMPAFEATARHGLTLDALTLPRHLKHLLILLERYPDLRVVIDHGSKPEIRLGQFDGWAQDMRALARQTSAYCKLSGLVTEASENWTVEDLKPYVDHLLAEFGPQRLVWGSDWPVCTLAASYGKWISTVEELLAGLSEAEASRVWHENAVEVYRLEMEG